MREKANKWQYFIAICAAVVTSGGRGRQIYKSNTLFVDNVRFATPQGEEASMVAAHLHASCNKTYRKGGKLRTAKE